MLQQRQAYGIVLIKPRPDSGPLHPEALWNKHIREQCVADSGAVIPSEHYAMTGQPFRYAETGMRRKILLFIASVTSAELFLSIQPNATGVSYCRGEESMILIGV